MNQNNLKDTTFSMDMQDYLSLVIQRLDMKIVHEIEFGNSEKQYFLFNDTDGLLLITDSYLDHRNSAKIYYNWRPKFTDYHKITSSGRLSKSDKTVWIGDHDARESVVHKINLLRENGRFIYPWIECDSPWLLNYGESKQILPQMKFKERMSFIEKINEEKLKILRDKGLKI